MIILEGYGNGEESPKYLPLVECRTGRFFGRCWKVPQSWEFGCRTHKESTVLSGRYILTVLYMQYYYSHLAVHTYMYTSTYPVPTYYST